MFLAEPPSTDYDLRFKLFGFPIRVHPFFWLLALFIGPREEPRLTLVWVVAVFVSVIVHELGHALAQRKYGGRPWIVLYGFGGLSISQRLRTSWSQNVFISLAGPFAGFFLLAILKVVTRQFGMPENELLYYFVSYLMWINLAWGVLNLLPIYPLDGGHVARELLTVLLPVSKGITVSLWVSIVVATLVGAYLFMLTGSFFNAFMFGALAYQNYQTLEAYQRSGGRW